MQTQNEVQVLIPKEIGLEPAKTEFLLKQFAGFFNKAQELAKVGRELLVTREDDLEGMAEAKRIRKELQDIRTKGVEPTRKELKEQSLREGKAIDGIANVIKALIVPVEEHLEKQEKFAQIAEENRKLELLENRRELLSHYVNDVYVFNLSEMTEEVFATLLENSKKAYEAQLAAEEEAEKKRVELEEKRKLYHLRALEIAPYAQFINRTLDLDTTREEYEEIFRNSIKAKQDYEAKQEEIRLENQKLREEALKIEKQAQEQKEKADREKQKRIAAENKLRKEREQQERAKLQEAAAKLAEERKKALAPDADKLQAFTEEIRDMFNKEPVLNNSEAENLLKSLLDSIDTLLYEFELQINRLKK